MMSLSGASDVSLRSPEASPVMFVPFANVELSPAVWFSASFDSVVLPDVTVCVLFESFVESV